MGNYEQLKEAIKAVIKTNGNQEITGQAMQDTLLAITSSFGQGALFAGIATPETNPLTPDQNVFYLASKSGVYPNFNGLSVADGEIVVFSLSDGQWTKQILSLGGGGSVTIINEPDEEDLTTVPQTAEKNVIRFKNRLYDEANASGKGYKILRKYWKEVNGVRKNILTQDMINDANTIYEIRYDFDLNGAEILIKEGCVLNFVGGSFKNGTINGEFDVVAGGTIFKNVEGSIKTNIAYSYYCGTKSSDINKCLNLFECKELKIVGDIEFDETIIINKSINLTWENGNIDIKSSNKIVFVIYPHAKNIAMGTSTILYNNSERENPFIKIYGYGSVDYNPHFTNYELPLIYNNIESTLNLKGIGVELVVNGENQYLYNSFIRMYGYRINTVLKITQEEGSTNITDNIFDIVSWNCTNGILFDNTHKQDCDYNEFNLMFQSSGNVEKVIGLKDATKQFSSLSVFNMSLWDTHLTQNTNIIDKFAKATYNNNIKTLEKFCLFYANKFNVNTYNKTSSKELLDSSLVCISDMQTIIYNILKNITSQDSREDIVKKIIYNILEQFDYTIELVIPYNNGTQEGDTPSLLTSIVNKIIYNPEPLITSTSNLRITISGYSRYKDIDFEINGVDFISHTLYTFKYSDNITNYNDINVINSKNKYIGLRSKNAPVYALYDPTFLDVSIYKDEYYENYKFAADSKKDVQGRNEIIYNYLQTCDLGKTKSHGRFVKGYMFFDTDKNKLMVYKGDNIWSDAFGNDKDTKGNTSQRPTLTSTDEGFEYYDSTLKKKILWNGIAWVNIDGTALQ